MLAAGARYLALSLEVDRIAPCFAGEPDHQRTRATQALLNFDQLSKFKSEQRALAEVEPMITFLLNSERFRQVAHPEERVAARFILGRAAMLRMAVDNDVE